MVPIRSGPYVPGKSLDAYEWINVATHPPILSTLVMHIETIGKFLPVDVCIHPLKLGVLICTDIKKIKIKNKSWGEST